MIIKYRPLNPAEKLEAFKPTGIPVIESPSHRWNYYTDRSGAVQFNLDEAECIADHLAKEGNLVQVWHGDILVHQTPKYDEPYVEAELYPEPTPAREEFNAKTVQILSEFNKLRGVNIPPMPSKWTHDTRANVISTIRRGGYLPFPIIHDDFNHSAYEEDMAVRAALPCTDAELALIHLYRSVTEEDDEAAGWELAWAEHWIVRAKNKAHNLPPYSDVLYAQPHVPLAITEPATDAPTVLMYRDADGDHLTEYGEQWLEENYPAPAESREKDAPTHEPHADAFNRADEPESDGPANGELHAGSPDGVQRPGERATG